VLVAMTSEVAGRARPLRPGRRTRCRRSGLAAAGRGHLPAARGGRGRRGSRRARSP